MANSEDIGMMRRVCEGDLAALGDLVRKYQDPLVNFFRRLGVHHDAEDLVQECFLRIYRHREQYRPCAKFTTYLYTVARSVRIDWVRRQARRQQAMTSYEEHLGVEMDVTAVDSPENERVQAAVETLPEKLRLVVVMSIYQELKYAEIAEILDIPVGTVKSRMSLAVGKLKEQLNVGIDVNRT